MMLYDHKSHSMFALLLISFLYCFTKTQGHGLMCTPRQRGAYLSSDKCDTVVNVDLEGAERDYCPHCLNGGSVASVRSNLPPSGWKIYDPIKDPAGSLNRATLCGDAVGNPEHMENGRFVPKGMPRVAHYRTGSEIDFVAELSTNHFGYMEYFLCDLDACGVSDIENKCFEEGHCYRLLRVKHPDCENSAKDEKMQAECGPIDDVYPGRWYIPCSRSGIVGGKNGYMRYKLPDGVKCEHCVIQWYWATANSCMPRGIVDYMQRLNYPLGKSCVGDGGGMRDCGGSALAEEFWSCADVKISDSGEGSSDTTGTTTSSASSPSPSSAASVDPADTPLATSQTPEPISVPTTSPQMTKEATTIPSPSSVPSVDPVDTPLAMSQTPEPTPEPISVPITSPEITNAPTITPATTPTAISSTVTPSVSAVTSPVSSPTMTMTETNNETEQQKKQKELLKKQQEEQQQKFKQSQQQQKEEREKQKKQQQSQQQLQQQQQQDDQQKNEKCTPKGQKCDGSNKCCDEDHICVFRRPLKQFQCSTWDEIRKDMELRK